MAHVSKLTLPKLERHLFAVVDIVRAKNPHPPGGRLSKGGLG